MPGKVLGYLLSRHAPVKLGMPLSGRELAWMWRWWRACKLETYAVNRARMQRLAFYSRQRLHQITADLKLEYDRSDGYLVLLRSEKERELTRPGLQVLRDAGVNFREVGPDEARKVEPALNPDTAFAGAIHLSDDEVGNCRQFALLLKDEARHLGARFEFNTTVASLAQTPSPALKIVGEAAPRVFDAIVLCAGLDSASLLRPLGLKVPMIAVHGYSVSAQVREPLNAPRSAVMDERYKVAISRLGQRVRVAGSAELGGSATALRASSLQTLYKVLHDWFPGAAHLSSGVQEWKGARPMLPDGPPVLGASGLPGVWINLGHGSSGWALSCGSARALADLMAGRAADVDLEGLGVERLRH
jgi:D-amino-acid dehydrogenase